MEKYLRPETLFGSKFENYLNAPAPKRKGANGININQDAPDDLAGILYQVTLTVSAYFVGLKNCPSFII